MRCPFCRHDELKVTDSRAMTDPDGIRRRRECQNCLRRFTTLETLELTIQVHKRDGRFEDFQEQKLINGLESACQHTRISREQVQQLAARIKGDLLEAQVRTITTRELGEMVMKHLQALDSIAYIRFACVYKRFKDLRELVEAIQNVEPKDGGESAEVVSLNPSESSP